MDFLDLANQCGGYVNPVTTLAIIRGESSFDPLVIRDNSTRITHHPKDKKEAEILVNNLHSQGHNLAIGLMQVTSQWLNKFNIEPNILLNPCLNIRYGTTILTDNYRNYLPISSSNEQALQYAISAYWSGNPYNGGKYVNYIYNKGGSSIKVKETPGISDGLLGDSTNPSNNNPKKSTFFSGSIFFPKEGKESLFMSR